LGLPPLGRTRRWPARFRRPAETFSSRLICNLNTPIPNLTPAPSSKLQVSSFQLLAPPPMPHAPCLQARAAADASSGAWQHDGQHRLSAAWWPHCIGRSVT